MFIENQTLPWDNHSVGVQVDALMVYRAFEALVDMFSPHAEILRRHA